MNVAPTPRILIIAGPNGAGKTTFAREFLPNEAGCPSFINADLIAAGIAPFDPEGAAVTAGKLMLQEIKRQTAQLKSFAFETTLSGKLYSRMISQWQHSGYNVKLIFLQLKSADDAVNRVAQRVRQGGHNIPEATIRRRYEKGIVNFQKIYSPIVDSWTLYDNSGHIPEIIDWTEKE